jgi:hypothetical protein
MAPRSLLPQLLVALLTAASILLAASAAHTVPADSAAVPPSAASRGARHLGQHHLFPNTAADDDAEPEYPTSSDAEAEPEDANDRNDMRALAAAEDGTFPRHRASKALVIDFVVILSAMFLALFICSAVQGARDEAITRERVHPLDAEDAAAGP